MNLEDVIDPEYGLQQDEWSLSKPRFGDEGQLEVIGWSGRDRWCVKSYTLKCRVCSQDFELFKGGYFSSSKSNLEMGSLPCGCSLTFRWSKEQQKIRCERKAGELGYKFLGFEGDWLGQRTKLKLHCDLHGEWYSCNIDNLISKSSGCPLCGNLRTKKSRTKSDDSFIKSFIVSGKFANGTLFKRTKIKSGKGRELYWEIYCPECNNSGLSLASNLKRGKRPCACSKHRQQEAYINWIMDNNNMTTGVKFGIARDSTQRITQQNCKSAYTLKQHSVYTFPDVESCKKAERECKQELECGVVLKRDMSDGWTETTWVHNLDKIIEIYERNGGVRNEKHSTNSNYLLDSLPRTS